MELRKILEEAKAKGLRPIDVPELMDSFSWSKLELAVEMWDIKADKYDKPEQSAEYAKKYPFYAGKRYGL